MSNLATLMVAAGEMNPAATFGTFQQHDRLERVLIRAHEIGIALRSTGLERGDVVAVIGNNCAAYLVLWIAAQLVGLRTALMNPNYPDEFVGEMLDDLAPKALIWISKTPGSLGQRRLLQIDATRAWEGEIVQLQDAARRTEKVGGSGKDCVEAEIAAYVHTSGTTGRPKFCALSHGYFLRLGRFFADTTCLSRHDVVVAPLPLFHINPLGNGVVSALTAGAALLSTEMFSASEFWPMVKEYRATVLVLHGPPANMLKKKTTYEDAHGHSVRLGFFCDPAFLRQFQIPIGVGGYGSTEAGGYCHSWKFRPADADLPAEGPMHLAGQIRFDMECRLANDGEILVRGKHPQTLFAGYAKASEIDPHLDPEGWFHTGDRGRWDAWGNLIFLERISESIRVNAEYVPIDFVEDRLKRVVSLNDFALWRVDSPTRGHEAVVYTTSREVDMDDLRKAVADLPKYMHPRQVIGIEVIPRDAGVGKIQRRLLNAQATVYVKSV